MYDFLGATGGDKEGILARNLIKEAESVIQDAEDFASMFGVSLCGSGDDVVGQVIGRGEGGQSVSPRNA